MKIIGRNHLLQHGKNFLKTVFLLPLLSLALQVECAPAARLNARMTALQTREGIRVAIANTAPQEESHRRYRMVQIYGAPLFPGDADLAAPPVSSRLANWLRLPAADRRDDLMISPDVDYFWPADGKLFSCEFLVHFYRLTGNETGIEILQIHPTIYLGKKFQLLGRTGPKRYMDLRPGAPSGQAEKELLQFIDRALDQPQPPQRE